jgi:hypothetical protein
MSASFYEPTGLNRWWLGILMGIVFPLVFFLLYFLFRFNGPSFERYLQILVQSGKIIHVLSLSVLFNLAPFLYFVRTNRFKSGKGVLSVTILFVLILFVLKFYL